VAPLRLGGLRWKQSTPSVWLGGTGVVSMVGEQERNGAQTSSRRAIRQRYGLLYFGRIVCIMAMLVSEYWLYLDAMVVSVIKIFLWL
jgi:hypothetical protein